MLKICKKLQEKRFVFVKILAIIIPENGAKVSKIKCLRLNQQTLHKKDSNTGSNDTVFDEFMDTCEEVQKADSITKKQMLTYSKLFQMNFTKMDPYEFKTFMDIVERYSTAFKSAKGNGRGKKKRK